MESFFLLDSISSSHNWTVSEGRKLKHKAVVEHRNTAKLFLKKSVIVSTTGQHNKYLLQGEETRKQEERTKINVSLSSSPLSISTTQTLSQL